MKVALTTLGCKLNYAETSTYERGFVAHGLEVVPWSAVADVYVINTCAVTETAEKKSRNLMRRAHKATPTPSSSSPAATPSSRKRNSMISRGSPASLRPRKSRSW